MAGVQDEDEIREFIRERARAIETLSWEELDRYGQRTEQFRTGSGASYRVVSKAFWDMGEWESGIEILVRAYAPTGRRRWWPYKAHAGRGGPTDMVGEPPPDWTPRNRRTRRRRHRRGAS